MKQGDGKSNRLNVERKNAATNGIKKKPQHGKCDLGPNFVAPGKILFGSFNISSTLHVHFTLPLFNANNLNIYQDGQWGWLVVIAAGCSNVSKSILQIF